MPKQITACWEVDKESIVVSCPSSQGGNYLVGVSKCGNILTIAHYCPAIESGNNCWHVKAAVEAFQKWRWWDISDMKIKSIVKKIELRPEWVQIPIPGTIPTEVLSVWG